MEKTPYFILDKKNTKLVNYLISTLKEYDYHIDNYLLRYDNYIKYINIYPVLVLDYRKQIGNVAPIRKDKRNIKDRYKVESAEEFLKIAAELKNKTYKQKNIVTKEDLVLNIKNIPLDIAQQMVNEQIKQGNLPDITVFQTNLNADKFYKGFNWGETEDGHEFWHKVLNEQNYELFFEKHNVVKQDFNINNIKPGMVVEYKSGGMGVVIEVCNKIYFIRNDRYTLKNNFCYDLTHISDDSLDICRVYNHKQNRSMTFESFFKKENLELIWERKLPKINITKEEIAKKFNCKVEQINII